MVTEPFQQLARIVAASVLLPDLPLFVLPSKAAYDDKESVLD